MNKKILITTIVQLFFFSFAKAAHAQSAIDFYKSYTLQPGSQGVIARFFQPLISLVPVATGIASLIVIILSGIRYISHAGNPVEVKKAADSVVYAIVGLGLSALAFVITQLLFQVGGAGGLF